ncbi:MAG: CNNM domain-containing protein, partial [Gammaproteobacteria bacterium]|nr:CNNM domain-containing protein [Gammaproteobacteria bacterium]
MQISDLPATILFGSLLILTMLSAYFSGSETAMIGLNRYRLKHSANEGN